MIRRNIPNILTSLNLLSGCTGIYFFVGINTNIAVLLIFIAALFDFLDGFSARLLGAYSPVGKSLDSLADLVSFGVLPGLLLLKLQINLSGFTYTGGSWQVQDLYFHLIIFSPLLIPLASAFRLAKFDNDPEQLHSFRGLPTPANAMFIAALVWAAPEGGSLIYNPHALLFLNLLLAWLLISPVRFISFKFKNYKLKDNLGKYLLVVIAITSILLWGIPGIIPAFAAYIFISAFIWITSVCP